MVTAQPYLAWSETTTAPARSRTSWGIPPVESETGRVVRPQAIGISTDLRLLTGDPTHGSAFAGDAGGVGDLVPEQRITRIRLGEEDRARVPQLLGAIAAHDRDSLLFEV